MDNTKECLFIKNFRYLVDRSGLSLYEVAKKANLDYTTVYRILKSKQSNEPRARTRAVVARVFGVDPSAMSRTTFDHDTPFKVLPDEEIPTQHSSPSRSKEDIPLAKSTYALQVLAILDDDLPVDSDGLFETESWLPPLPFHSKEEQKLVAIKAVGNALAPMILEGDLVYLDQVTEPKKTGVKNGNLVLAVAKGADSLVLRKLVIDDMGQQWLMATNPDWPGQRSVACEQIVGIVTAIARQF